MATFSVRAFDWFDAGHRKRGMLKVMPYIRKYGSVSWLGDIGKHKPVDFEPFSGYRPWMDIKSGSKEWQMLARRGGFSLPQTGAPTIVTPAFARAINLRNSTGEITEYLPAASLVPAWDFNGIMGY